MSIRCAVYTRKSSEQGLEQAFNSLDAQREACEAYVKSQAHEGWRLISRHYDDGGFTGGNMQRPGLTRLLADVAAGNVDVIVVYKVDRLTRSLADFARIVDRLDAKKTSFVAVTQSFSTTSSMGRLTLNMLLSFAQFERELTSERIRDKVAASKAKGMWMGGTPPLGYRSANRALEVIPEEADLVRRIFGRYVELQSLTALAAELARTGVRSKVYVAGKGRVGRSVPFQVGPLIGILRSSTYLGEVRHKAASYAGQHQAIVPRALWEAAQSQLDSRSPRGAGAGAHDRDFILRELVFGCDGGVFRLGQTDHSSGRVYRYYLTGGLASPEGVTRVPAEKLEAVVEQTITERLAPTERTAWRQLKPAKRERQIRRIVRRVEVERDVVHVTLDTRRMASESPPRRRGRPRRGDPGPIVRVSIPVKFKRFVPPVIAPPNEEEVRPTPDRDLVTAMARAHLWRARVESGKYASIDAMAAAHRIGAEEIHRLLPLAYLAPVVTDAVLSGGQSRRCSLKSTTEVSLPVSWTVQGDLYVNRFTDD